MKKKCNIISKEDDNKLKNAFLGAYNAQKHCITICDISIANTAKFPSKNLYPSTKEFPSNFSCKWRQLNEGDINNIVPYNERLSGKDILPTIKEMNELINEISKKL